MENKKNFAEFAIWWFSQGRNSDFIPIYFVLGAVITAVSFIAGGPYLGFPVALVLGVPPLILGIYMLWNYFKTAHQKFLNIK